MSEINKLTDKKLKNIHGKEISKPVMIADGRGLSILVSKKGSISWSYSYRFEGKLSRMIIGQYPDLSMKQPQDKASSNFGFRAWPKYQKR
nr:MULTISPECIES: Arm DNA-binding domain-containing protein [Providencia]